MYIRKLVTFGSRKVFHTFVTSKTLSFSDIAIEDVEEDNDT